MITTPQTRREADRLGVNEADWNRYAGYLAEIFEAFGLDPDSPGTRTTPHRFLAALRAATAGYDGDPRLITTFPTEARAAESAGISQITQGPISFHALCEHHALPFFGTAHVAYVAGDEIIGISKLTRLVRLYARRFTVQERIGEQVADALAETVRAQGVAVRIQAVHLCMRMRGVSEQEATTVTTSWRGRYLDDPALRQEFLGETRFRGATG